MDTTLIDLRATRGMPSMSRIFQFPGSPRSLPRLLQVPHHPCRGGELPPSAGDEGWFRRTTVIMTVQQSAFRDRNSAEVTYTPT